MDLTIKTLRGSTTLSALPQSFTVEELKSKLYTDYGASLSIPEPLHQNIVHCGRLLTSGTLSEIIPPGSTLCMLQTTPLSKASPPFNPVGPSASEIREAIYEEARRRGIEDQLRDEGPVTGSTESFPRELLDMDNQLIGLIEALEGRLGMFQQQGAHQPRQAEPAASADERATQEPVEDIVPPEPDASHISQITDMGFSEALARKALIMHRGRVPEAVEWVLMHGEDSNAEQPLTQDQLRRIYAPLRASVTAAPVTGGGGGGGGGQMGGAAVSSALRELQLSLLQAVGLDAEHAGRLLDRQGNQAGSMTGRRGAPRDPLENFRRRLLGHHQGGGSESAVATSLSDIFPIESLIALNAAAENVEHNEEEEQEEEEEEEGEGEEYVEENRNEADPSW